MYFVKTRNWHCNPLPKKFLDLTLKIGAKRLDSYDDGDGKYGFESRWLIIAAFMFLYWKILEKWTGGWTYIVNRNKGIDIHPPKSIFLWKGGDRK